MYRSCRNVGRVNIVQFCGNGEGGSCRNFLHGRRKPLAVQFIFEESINGIQRALLIGTRKYKIFTVTKIRDGMGSQVGIGLNTNDRVLCICIFPGSYGKLCRRNLLQVFLKLSGGFFKCGPAFSGSCISYRLCPFLTSVNSCLRVHEKRTRRREATRKSDLFIVR